MKKIRKKKYYITTSNIHTFSTDFSFDSFVVFSISHTYGYNILIQIKY